MEPRCRFAAHPDIEVARDIDGHAVATVIGQPIDECPAIADRALWRKILRKASHQPLLCHLALLQEVVRSLSCAST